MTNTTKKRTMPKGGRKGGAIFPRINLKQAAEYAERLVSKTHTGPQPADVIHSGVLGARGGTGQVRISALKQFGFVKGDTKVGFEASAEAKRLASSPPEELKAHYRAAALRPKIFKAIFDTYHGDKVSRGKLKQRAATLNVHPDFVDACVDNYLASLELAEMVTAEGDSYAHLSAADLDAATSAESEEETILKEEVDPPVGDNGPPDPEDDPSVGKAGEAEQAQKDIAPLTTTQAIFNVNVTLDSSLDSDKLEKQLELLRKYGAIK